MNLRILPKLHPLKGHISQQTNEFIPIFDVQTYYFWKRPCAFHRENFEVYFGEE